MGAEGDLPELRVSDAERERTLAALREHYATGRLTLEELADRVEVALRARTAADLVSLTKDLPDVRPSAPSEPGAPVSTRVVAIMGGTERSGRWRAGQHIAAFAFMGGCKIDLREAEVDLGPGGGELEITATAFMGGIEIIVPEGVRVEMSGFSFMGGRTVRVRDAGALPGMPVIHVHGFAIMGGVEVKSRPRHRPRLDRPSVHAGVHRMVSGILEGQPVLPVVSRSIQDILQSVLGELPQARRAASPAPDGPVTVLFSDIEDFTGITDRLGDRRAHDLLRDQDRIVRDQVERFGGRVVKSNGDGFMVTFGSTRQGLRCALGIQDAVAEYATRAPDEPVRVRIGLHTGEAIREGDDVFGRNVIVAARIADAAHGGEVLVSSVVRELVAGSDEFAFDEGRKVELKGLQGEHQVHLVRRS